MHTRLTGGRHKDGRPRARPCCTRVPIPLAHAATDMRWTGRSGMVRVERTRRAARPCRGYCGSSQHLFALLLLFVLPRIPPHAFPTNITARFSSRVQSIRKDGLRICYLQRNGGGEPKTWSDVLSLPHSLAPIQCAWAPLPKCASFSALAAVFSTSFPARLCSLRGGQALVGSSHASGAMHGRRAPAGGGEPI